MTVYYFISVDTDDDVDDDDVAACNRGDCVVDDEVARGDSIVDVERGDGDDVERGDGVDDDRGDIGRLNTDSMRPKTNSLMNACSRMPTASVSYGTSRITFSKETSSSSMTYPFGISVTGTSLPACLTNCDTLMLDILVIVLKRCLPSATRANICASPN